MMQSKDAMDFYLKVNQRIQKETESQMTVSSKLVGQMGMDQLIMLDSQGQQIIEQEEE